MPPKESNLIKADSLLERLGDASVVIIDCRFELAQPQAGLAAYQQGHIPGAFYLHLEAEMSGPKQTHGGRHPLPDMADFSRKLGALGVDSKALVVAYDAQNGCMAARLWWMLRYLGHSQVKVLDGGWPMWLRRGYPATIDIPAAAPANFAPHPHPEFLLGIEDLRARLGDKNLRLVDSRAAERYRGEVEPLDPVAGHIPRALNWPWTNNQDNDGALKPVERLQEGFAPLRKGSGELIVYCGSGVTACANLLAMEEAGFDGARLYAGGWSDWCSYPANPAAKGDNDNKLPG